VKLLSNGKNYIGLFGNIKDGDGVPVVAPHIVFIAKGTPFNITKVSADTFSINTGVTFELSLGEEISLVQSDFDIECIVSKVGHNLYKVIPRFQGGNSFLDEVDLIPDGITQAVRENDYLEVVSLENGSYYTEFGELLLVKETFHHLSGIGIDEMYGRKPILRGRATEKWQLAILLRTAYNDVMNDLENYEINEFDRFQYIDTGRLFNLIVFKAIALYEDSLPESEEIEKTFSVKYKGEITGFAPKKKITDEKVVEDTKKKGLRY